jgi:hypothetical protein
VVRTNVDVAVHSHRGSWSPSRKADDGGQVAVDLWGTLGFDPNRAGNGSVHLLVTLDTDPRSVMEQRVGWRKREGVVGGSASVSVENLVSGQVAGHWHVEGEGWQRLMKEGLKEGRVLSMFSSGRMYFLQSPCIDRAWHGVFRCMRWWRCGGLQNT